MEQASEYSVMLHVLILMACLFAPCSTNPVFGGKGKGKQGDDYAAAPNIDHTQVRGPDLHRVILVLCSVPTGLSLPSVACQACISSVLWAVHGPMAHPARTNIP